MLEPTAALLAALVQLPIAVTLVTAPAVAAETQVPRTVEVLVDRGYKADSFEVKEGEPVRLTFLRKEHTPCTKEVVFPALGIRKELPVNQPVTIELPPQKAGEVEFHCGMKMTKGKIVVKPHG